MSVDEEVFGSGENDYEIDEPLADVSHKPDISHYCMDSCVKQK